MCESVQVAVRIRPLVAIETTKGCKDILEVLQDLNQIRIRDTDKAFTYNHVFGTSSSQDQIYEKCVRKMVQHLFNGYNLTVLAYGQTGSGKTHTMGTTYAGTGEMGVIPRAVTEIFDSLRDNFTLDSSITVSFMELYQETLYDLLADKSRDQCVLDIREDQNKGIMIPGLTQVPVKSVSDVFNELIRGSSSRATSATNMNAQSSRSHAIFTLNLVMQSKADGSEKTAKFHLVDLAGSERPKKTGAVGTTFKEGVNINKGLLVLGNVISALGDEKHQHGYIPYRDSNLTRLLKDSLGGNSITLMIACVSPADYNMEETVSTLRYADRARRIQNKPVVNQDPKAAEVNQLKKIIQELKLQIVGQGGPAVGSQEIASMKEDNLRLQTKIRDLTFQLSSTLNDNTGLLEKLMILQNANENLHKKIQELRGEYDVTINSINASLDQNDHEEIRKNLVKLQRIQEQFGDIDSEQKRTESEILSHEQNIDLHNSQNGQFKDEGDLSKDHENYTNKQMALNIELQELTKKLAIKEHLARQITTNTHHLVDYKAMAENEDKILNLEKEKNELLQQLKNAQGSSTKLSEQRRKRVQELESQIHDLNRKVQEQARLIKLKEKDVTKINQLNNEILQMKQTRVRLIRKMREESERFRTWKIQRERELAKLKQQDRKKQNQIVKMEVMHSKQQNVLKRKVEEAVALNKRLKDALALRKVTQDAKHVDKDDRIGCWIRQDLEVRMHLVEAATTLEGLLEDRGVLQEQLNRLKEEPGEDESQIRSLEEDIELRSVQIQGLQQKILDSEEENKKSKLDNIQTMSDAKFALKTLLEQATEIKKKEVTMRNKCIEIQANLTDTKHTSENLEKVVKLMEYKHAEDISSLQNEYEEKIAVLLRQLRGIQVQNVDEEVKQRCAIQTEKIDTLDKANQDLMARLVESEKQVQELQQKIETITQLAQKSESKAAILEECKTPLPRIRKKPLKIKQEVDSTFVVENQENLDISLEVVDDIDKDPDWKRTPIGKWILERKRRGLQKSQDGDDSNQTFKRTSDGGCMCQKSNCTTRCGCRKTKRKCTSGCKCSSSCTNKSSDSDLDNSSESQVGEDKRLRLMKTNLFHLGVE